MDANRLKTCNCCGSKLNLSLLEKNKYVKCEYCDAYNDINIHDEKFERLIDEVKIELRNGNFDKADEKVEELLSTYKDEPLVYFYKVLVDCKIVYVKEDPDDEESKGIPTYTSIKFNSPAVTKYGKKCLEKEKDSKIAASYEKVFNTIEKDREAIKKLLTDKDPRHDYDVFICFKKSDVEDPSKDTPEAKEAQRLYTYLCKTYGDKLKVFYAPESLDGSAPWEQLIFNALARAKLLIVIGYSSDTLNATWVKNEWNRFIDMMEDGNFGDKEIFVAGASDGSVSYIPKKLKKYQAKPADTSLHAEIKKTIDEVIFHSFEKVEEPTPTKVEKKTDEVKTIKIETPTDAGSIEQVKVRTFDHNHSEANIEIDLILSKTDVDLAIKHLNDESRYPNQDDPELKKAKFVIKNGEIKNIGKGLTEEKFDSIKAELEDIIDTESFDDIFMSLVVVAESNQQPLKFRMKLIKYLFEHYGYIEENNTLSKELVDCSYKLFTNRTTLKDNSWNDSVEYFDDLYKFTYSKCDKFKIDKRNLTYFVCLRSIKLFKQSQFKEYFKGLPQEFTLNWHDVFNLSKISINDHNWAYQFSSPVSSRFVVYSTLVAYLHEKAFESNNGYDALETLEDGYDALTGCMKETNDNADLAILNYLLMVNEFLTMLCVSKRDTKLLDEFYEAALEHVILNNKTDEDNAKFMTEQYNVFKEAVSCVFDSNENKEAKSKKASDLSAKISDTFAKGIFVRLFNVNSKKREELAGARTANAACLDLIEKKSKELENLGKKVPKRIKKSIDNLKSSKDIHDYNKKSLRIIDDLDNELAKKIKANRGWATFYSIVMLIYLAFPIAILAIFGFRSYNSLMALDKSFDVGIYITYSMLLFLGGLFVFHHWGGFENANKFTLTVNKIVGVIVTLLSYLFFASFFYLFTKDVMVCSIKDGAYILRMVSTPIIGILLFISSQYSFIHKQNIRFLYFVNVIGTAVFAVIFVLTRGYKYEFDLYYLQIIIILATFVINLLAAIDYYSSYSKKNFERAINVFAMVFATAIFATSILGLQALGNHVIEEYKEIRWLVIVNNVIMSILTCAPYGFLMFLNIRSMIEKVW